MKAKKEELRELYRKMPIEEFAELHHKDLEDSAQEAIEVIREVAKERKDEINETCFEYIIETWEEMTGETDYGKLMWEHGGTYTYRLPDGREFTQYAGGHGRLKPEFQDLSQPYPIEVEYLPDNPTVSRIKGDGPNSIPSWLRTEVGYWAFFPLILLAFGVYLLWKAVSELRNQDNNKMGTME